MSLVSREQVTHIVELARAYLPSPKIRNVLQCACLAIPLLACAPSTEGLTGQVTTSSEGSLAVSATANCGSMVETDGRIIRHPMVLTLSYGQDGRVALPGLYVGVVATRRPDRIIGLFQNTNSVVAFSGLRYQKLGDSFEEQMILGPKIFDMASASGELVLQADTKGQVIEVRLHPAKRYTVVGSSDINTSETLARATLTTPYCG